VQSGSGTSLNSLRSAGAKTRKQRAVVTTSLGSFSKQHLQMQSFYGTVLEKSKWKTQKKNFMKHFISISSADY
jgi:hypothetical protein